MKQIKNVHISEVKKGNTSDTLTAILGSCIGIGFIWKKEGKYALAHCLLAKSPTKTFNIGAKYVDQAIASLIALLKVKDEDKKDIDVVIAGGGNMFPQHKHSTKQLIGEMNSESAITILKELNFRIAHQEIGGTNGRKIEINCNSGDFKIKDIKKQTTPIKTRKL